MGACKIWASEASICQGALSKQCPNGRPSVPTLHVFFDVYDKLMMEMNSMFEGVFIAVFFDVSLYFCWLSYPNWLKNICFWSRIHSLCSPLPDLGGHLARKMQFSWVFGSQGSAHANFDGVFMFFFVSYLSMVRSTLLHRPWYGQTATGPPQRNPSGKCKELWDLRILRGYLEKVRDGYFSINL